MEAVTWCRLFGYVEQELFLNDSRNGKAFKYQTPHVKRLLAHVEPDKLAYDDIEFYKFSRLKEGAKPKTVNNELSWIRKALRNGWKRGLLVDLPPIENLVVPDNTRRGFATPDELELVVENLSSEVVRDIVRFAYNTGWRKGEILALRWDDVDRESCTVRLWAGTEKTRRARVYPYGRCVGRIINSRWADRSCGTGCQSALVFHRRGEPVRDFSWTWMKATARAGVPDLRFHDLRRSFARNARRAGVPEEVVMQLMGHTTRSMFLRYRIVDEDDLRQHTSTVETSVSPQ